MQKDLFKDTRLFSYEMNRRLREYRRNRGLSLSYVAQTLKIPEDQLKDYEEGKKQLPLDYLSKLATLYNVSPVYFLGGDMDFPSTKQPSSPAKGHVLF